MEQNQVLDKMYVQLHQISQELLRIWLSSVVFTWRWWLGVALTVIPWFLWIKYRDKSNTVRLLFIGMLVAIITNALDMIGLCFGLWHYDWKLIPLINSYIPWDYALFPVSIMFSLQWKPKIKGIYKSIVISFIYTFVFEPVFIWLHMYQIENWKIIYSFIIYIPLYLFFHAIYHSKLFITDEKK